MSELREKGVTVFINSHLLMEVEQTCDHVVIMNNGRLIREGTIEELTTRTGRVTFEIDPVPEDLRRALDGLGAGFEPNDHGFELSLSPTEQDEVIDRLRAAGVSVRSITAGKMTLEQAFIDLVREGAA